MHPFENYRPNNYGLSLSDKLQAKLFNETIISKPRHYVQKHQRNRAIYMQQFSYAYSAQLDRPTKLHPFSLVPQQQPLGSKLFHSSLG